ncbi:hypothetical protein AAG742_03450 [Micrococcus sp. 2A]|uniref:hypothetical protein n=1 Tax=Micrococcus sp. 2A TaxID=3142261 RepID=UPI0031BAEFE9
MMLESNKYVVGEVAGPPRVLAPQGAGELGDFAVVIPLKVKNRFEGQPDYWDVVIDAGEDPTEPGPLSARGQAVLEQVHQGDLVGVAGDWHVMASAASPGTVSMQTHRLYAMEINDGDGNPLKVDPEAVMPPMDPREPFVVEDWNAPLYPRGAFLEREPWDESRLELGQASKQVMRPLTSAQEAKEAVWTTPMHRRPHALAERGVEPREQPAPQVQVRATDAELEQAGVDREELTRGARRLSLELGAQFLPREADRRSAAEALEAMEPRRGARPARATWTPENPRATTAQRRVPKAAGSEIDRAAEAMARGQVPSPGVSGPEGSGPSR